MRGCFLTSDGEAAEMGGIYGVVEGDLDKAVLEKLLIAIKKGLRFENVYVKRGRRSILSKIDGYKEAAANIPCSVWIVLVDLDRDECAPALQKRYGAGASSGFVLRIAVRAVEAWLLGDRGNMARFLSVPKRRIPSAPEGLSDPKAAIVNIARASRSGKVKKAIVPRHKATSKVGPEYTLWMQNFAVEKWSPDEAKKNCPSLAKAMDAIKDALMRHGYL